MVMYMQRGLDGLRYVERAADLVFAWVARGCGWVLTGLAFMITLDIILRELRAAGIIGFNWQFVAEWSTYMVMLVVFWALAYTLRTDGHITVSLLVQRFPHRARNVLALLTATVSEVVLVYMLYRGIQWMELSIDRNIRSSVSIYKTPVWIPNLFIVIGLSLFALAILLHIVRLALEIATGPSKPADEAETPTPTPEGWL